MSSVIVDLTAQRGNAAQVGPLQHPAGVKLPFEGPSDAALIIPEIRSEVRAGTYSADMIGLLAETIEPGDRVLVIGAGLGVVSTLVANAEGVERVIAVEANTALIPYLNRVHALNDVSNVETVNAVLAEDKRGRVPFFARRDLRLSSLLPHDRSWQQVMMVPFMNLNLILAEERISLVVCDIPVAAATLVAHAALETVDRVLVNCADEPAACWEEDGACAQLIQRGFLPEPAGGAVLFRRAAGILAKEARVAEDLQDEALDDEDLDDEEDFGDEDDDEFEDEVAEDADAAAEPEPKVLEDDVTASEAAGEPADELVLEGAEPAAKVEGDVVQDDLARDDLPEDDAPKGSGLLTDFTPILDPGPRPRDDVRSIETEWEVEARRAGETGFAAEDHFASLFKDLPGERAAARQTDESSEPSDATDSGDVRDDSGPAPQPVPPVAPTPSAASEAPSAPQAEFAPAEEAVPPRAAEPSAPEPRPVEPQPAEPRPVAARDGSGFSDAGRLWTIGGLALALALPLMAIGEFAGSRAERHAAAAAQSMAVWGGPQTLTGPFLVVPVQTNAGVETPPVIVLPDRLQVASQLETSLRREGAFPIPAYRGRHDVSLDFDPDFLAGARVSGLLAAGESLNWDQAALGLGISQPKALTGAPVLGHGIGQSRFEAGTGPVGLPGILAPTGDPRGDARGWSFSLDLDGATAFSLTPAGRITEARIEAAWDAPGIGASAEGAFRPGSEQAGLASPC